MFAAARAGGCRDSLKTRPTNLPADGDRPNDRPADRPACRASQSVQCDVSDKNSTVVLCFVARIIHDETQNQQLLLTTIVMLDIRVKFGFATVTVNRTECPKLQQSNISNVTTTTTITMLFIDCEWKTSNFYARVKQRNRLSVYA